MYTYVTTTQKYRPFPVPQRVLPCHFPVNKPPPCREKTTSLTSVTVNCLTKTCLYNFNCVHCLGTFIHLTIFHVLSKFWQREFYVNLKVYYSPTVKLSYRGTDQWTRKPGCILFLEPDLYQVWWVIFFELNSQKY